MTPNEAATRLGISQRMLRHYEKEKLMSVARGPNNYRTYSEADLRRARRIHELIEIGFSTREIRLMHECLTDQGAGPCEAGIEKMSAKLSAMDAVLADLNGRRRAIIDRIDHLQALYGEDKRVVNL